MFSFCHLQPDIPSPTHKTELTGGLPLGTVLPLEPGWRWTLLPPFSEVWIVSGSTQLQEVYQIVLSIRLKTGTAKSSSGSQQFLLQSVNSLTIPTTVSMCGFLKITIYYGLVEKGFGNLSLYITSPLYRS